MAIAANMTYAMAEIIDKFETETGNKVRVSYGSSGNFTRKLLQGAPYELFLTAHRKYMDKLLKETDIIQNSTVYALGRIGFFAPNDSGLAEIENLNAIIKALQFGQYQRMVIANPEHAPYGIAAQQALQQSGLWTIKRKRLLLAENASQAAQFSVSGGIDVGIIPYSLAIVPEIAQQGQFFMAPESWHEPIEQHLIIMRNASETTKQFYNYLLSDNSKATLQKYGYAVP